MTNKEFVEYCKIGNIDKVKEGISDKKINPSAWNSRSLQYAHGGLVATKSNKVSSPYSKIIDLLIQNTNVDPSVDIFVGIWAVKYCEFETVKLIFNHPNIINNPRVFNHSFQIVENAFLIERLDIAEFLLKLKSFNHQKALSGYIEWGKNTEKLEKLKLILKNGASLEKLELYVLDILAKDIIQYDDVEFFKTLLEISGFDLTNKNNQCAVLASTTAPKIFDLIKDDYRVQEAAVKFQQTNLINKNIADIFIF